MVPGIKPGVGLLSAGSKSSPIVISRTANNSGAGASSTHTVNLPASLVVGNKLIACMGVRSIGGAGSFTWPAGWTEKLDSLNMSVAERIIDGSEGASISVTGPAGRGTYACIQVANHDSSQSIELTESAATTSTNPDPPSLTPSWTDPTLFIAFAASGVTNDFTAAPSGYSGFQNTRASNDPALATAEKAVDPGAVENPGTFTNSSSGTWVGVTIAVRGT